MRKVSQKTISRLQKRVRDIEERLARTINVHDQRKHAAVSKVQRRLAKARADLAVRLGG